VPEISRFFGIIIRMFPGDHAPPHLHAAYGEFEFCLDIRTGEVTEGFGPSKQVSLVRQWMELHRDELLTNWERAEAMLPPKKIAPLT
jgi:hypothetical protein